LIAVSADPPVTAQQTARELGLTFPVLSDSYRNFIRAYDVLHPQEQIARPSVFVIDKEGTIKWQYIGMSAGDRPEMATILQELKGIQ
jgi:peroxiredoxin